MNQEEEGGQKEQEARETRCFKLLQEWLPDESECWESGGRNNEGAYNR